MMGHVSDQRPIRGHETLPHTADVGLRGWGPTREAAFEEAAVALGELTAEIRADKRRVRSRTEQVEIEARDAIGLAYAWLNELVGLIDVRGAVSEPTVEVIEGAEGSWRLRGSVGLVLFDGNRVRRRADVKSATYHRLSIAEDAGTWTMTAYLDV
jgi:tRNA nucleotidyltransferase (CCA-adding enzyme)